MFSIDVNLVLIHVIHISVILCHVIILWFDYDTHELSLSYIVYRLYYVMYFDDGLRNCVMQFDVS